MCLYYNQGTREQAQHFKCLQFRVHESSSIITTHYYTNSECLGTSHREVTVIPNMFRLSGMLCQGSSGNADSWLKASVFSQAFGVGLHFMFFLFVFSFYFYSWIAWSRFALIVKRFEMACHGRCYIKIN